MIKFELSNEEERTLRKWEENHKCPLRSKSCCGGETTICFTPTSIGVAVDAKCICGAKIELRELWANNIVTIFMLWYNLHREYVLHKKQRKVGTLCH